MFAILEARDCGPKGIKVFAISPGLVRSNLCGPDEAARSGWNKAGDPEVSGQIVLDIVPGSASIRDIAYRYVSIRYRVSY
jgi:NAD(P)-dependent dehydrogenase (short-subunit alcohol dehydrogenase family)